MGRRVQMTGGDGETSLPSPSLVLVIRSSARLLGFCVSISTCLAPAGCLLGVEAGVCVCTVCVLHGERGGGTHFGMWFIGGCSCGYNGVSILPAVAVPRCVCGGQGVFHTLTVAPGVWERE